MSWPGLGDLLVWGVQAGWQVLGRPVNIYFTENGLGYTHPARYGQPAEIYVNPEVLNQPGGRLLLQGLILHEIGHHACHFGDPAYQAVCVRLKHKGLGSLLNAVLDEHLERRLRALDAKWGESFDALASHVFKGKDLTISLDLYAALLGFKTIEEAAASLLSSATPGRVIDYEHGYRLVGLDNRWVPFVAFMDMLTADMLAWFEGGKMPEDIAGTMRRLRETVSDPYLRSRPDGALEVIRQNRLFASEGGEFRRSNSEVTARISVTSLLENPPGTYTDIPTYLACLRRAVTPLLASFPDLKHFVDELDASAHSPWFWNKRNSMLYMMRRSRDYRYAFDPAREMSREEITRIIGRSVFDPVAILLDLIERIRPTPDVNVERPNKIRLAWTELLVFPGSSSYARFFISLRLGLGRQFVGDDPVAAAALAAVPRQLRKLDMEGLRAVAEQIAGILGDEACDETESCGAAGGSAEDAGKSAGGSEGAGGSERSVISGWLAGAASDVLGELSGPLGETTMSDDTRNEARREAKEATRRIDHWLRTAVDPASEQSEAKPAITTGGKSEGVDVFRRKPSGCHRGAQSGDQIDRDFLNLAETLEFDPILETVKPPEKTREHALLIRPLRGQIKEFRAYLAAAGSEECEEPASRSGRRLDPGRVRRLAAFGQPEVLIGMESRPAPDLFLGVCIDCSGSMSFEDRMEKAISFAALLLESARGLPGVDCFALGFDDEVIYEVGRPGSTRLPGLTPSGGNNDAAGLLALARHALLSPRQKRLLVMISDGFPTECSLDSLTNLVSVLDTRYGLKSVQVAVAEMEADRVAFPNFTDLTQHDRRMAVRVFGRMVRRILEKEFGY